MKRAEGRIVKTDPARMQAKVELFAREDSDGRPMVTDWLQILFTGPDTQYTYREKDYVALIMDDHFDDGWIIGRLYPDNVSGLESDEKKFSFKFKNGSGSVTFDETTGEAVIKIGSTAEIKITQQGIEISGLGEGNAINGVVHAMSPCPVFGTCHLQPSTTIKVSQ